MRNFWENIKNLESVKEKNLEDSQNNASSY